MCIKMKRFYQRAGSKPELENIVYSDSRLKKDSFFEPFCAHLDSKLAKSDNMTPRNNFRNNFDVGVKNAEFEADFNLLKKVFKSCYHESEGIMSIFTFQYCVQKFLALKLFSCKLFCYIFDTHIKII
jgi:hypothetical protein